MRHLIPTNIEEICLVLKILRCLYIIFFLHLTGSKLLPSAMYYTFTIMIKLNIIMNQKFVDSKRLYFGMIDWDITSYNDVPNN